MPLLNPRYYRIDDILRSAFTPSTPFGPTGHRLWAESPQGWGFSGGIHGMPGTGREGALLRLQIAGDGEPVLPGDTIFRPSHITSHAIGGLSGIQVTEDRFISHDDVAVSVVQVRNPGEYSILVQIDHSYGVPAGESKSGPEACWVYRESPPGDDLWFTLGSLSMRTLVFAVGIGETEEQARRRVWRWRNSLDPISRQRDEYQAWFDEHVAGFDCPDPWFARLWYHRWYVARRNGEDSDNPAGAVYSPSQNGEDWERYCRTQYIERDFHRPYLATFPAQSRETPVTCLLAKRIVGDLLGIRLQSEKTLAFDPRSPASEWGYFCLENLALAGKRMTFVWDDPNCKDDAYDDGDKGFTVYCDGRRIYHQETLTAALISLEECLVF